MRTLLSISLVLLLCVPALAQADASQQLDGYCAELAKAKDAAFWATVRKILTIDGELLQGLLKTKLADKELAPRVRLGLAKALADSGQSRQATPHLLRLLGESNGMSVRLIAAELLATHGDKSLDKRLKSEMIHASDPRMKIALAKALFRCSKSTRATMQLLKLVKDEDVEVRYAAALAMGEIGAMLDSARKVLRKLEKEPSQRGRLAHQMLEQDRADRRRYDSRPKKKEIALLEEVIQMIREYHVKGGEFTRQELMALAIKGMAKGVDRHTVYWTPQDWAKFLKDISGDYAGIGAYVEFRRGVFTIISPIYSGPAYRSGLRSRDQILSVEGWATRGQPIDEIIRRITGTPGTAVKLTVYREGWEKSREMSIVRAKIKVKSVKHDMLPGRIGYIRLDQFGSDSEDEVKAALDDLKSKGMKGLIFDLRNNGGGYMLTATRIADMFLTEGKLIVYSEGKHKIIGRRQDIYATADTVYPDGPIYMLVNDGSASASEILAGALQVHKRATLIGERTFGKGTVQQPFKLDTAEGARLKLTIARYYLPNDRSIDTRYGAGGKLIQQGGIKPDVQLTQKRYAAWKNEEYTRIREKRGFKRYLKKHFESNKKLFLELAVNDRRDASRYPGFDTWYASLGTQATQQDAREWLRDFVRERAADHRGAEFAHDLLEDRQLQKAVLMMCTRTGQDAGDIKAFKSFVKAFEEEKGNK